MTEADLVLKEVFGLPSFRGQQAEIVRHVVRGGDAVVLLRQFRRNDAFVLAEALSHGGFFRLPAFERGPLCRRVRLILHGLNHRRVISAA